ncbi:putative glucose transporter rco-3 [Microdochium bolleyi]|uniref:Putative glucose transporter rco-3 n=1 Tax=Microdochium bolleyi TaxID=196109 RepID=A0A136J353_9PEZI|nr:putative glucose transporter rco-3 [Microdochium bolleyi]
MAIAMGWQKPDNVAGSSAPAIMVGLFVASAGLLFGYDTGSINGILAMRAFIRDFNTGYIKPSKGTVNLSPGEISTVVAILSAGTFVGALISAPFGDWVGRRHSIIYSTGVFCLGVVLQICAAALPMMVAGRFFAGVGVGAISVLVPLYQSEMAPKWIRGTLVCAYQLSITVGLLAASIVNLLTSNMTTAAAYRIPIGLQFSWAVVLAAGLSILPETPRYLIKKGKKHEAGLALSRLRRLDITHPALAEELAEIEANHEYELALGGTSYKDIFTGSPYLGRRLLTGCLLQMLQQLTGINFIMYYGTTFFEGAGVSDPFVISLVLNVINVVTTLPGLVVVESWGRRKLLIVGAIGMAVCQLTIAIFSTVVGDTSNSASQSASKILIAFIAIFIFFYASSWGPVAWVVTSEIYPLKVRAKSMSISTASNWLLNFGIAFGTPYMVEGGVGYADLGSKVFYVWGAFCIIAAVFVYAMIYETSKISLEQIDEMYERVDVAWKSKKFEPAWSFQALREDNLASANANLNTTPMPPHELQPARTGSSTGGSVQTTNTNGASASSDETRTEEDKIIRQMGMSNVDFSY